MRLNLTDVQWAWLRASEHQYQNLRTVDAQYQVFMPTFVVATLLRAADLRTRYAVLLRPRDAVSARDRVPTRLVSKMRVDLGHPVDKARFRFAAINRDSVGTSEALDWSFSAKHRSPITAQDLDRFYMWKKFASATGPSDSRKFRFTKSVKDYQSTSDARRFRFSKVVKDVAPATDFADWSFLSLLRSVQPAVDRINVSFAAGLRDLQGVTDRMRHSFIVTLRDDVTAVSSFDIDGIWSYSSSESSPATDAFYSRMTFRRRDTVSTSDSVVIGVRSVVDFYLGGLSFGGGPFGGRII